MENRQVIRKRQKARKLLVQALYQAHLNHADAGEIIAQFLTENDTSKFDQTYFEQILKGILREQAQIDAHIKNYLDRTVELLNPVEFAVLRLSTYEFLHCLDIPFRVVIDEAISLCKTYGAVEGHRYVNGVLHQLASELRGEEVKHANK